MCFRTVRFQLRIMLGQGTVQKIAGIDL